MFTSLWAEAETLHPKMGPAVSSNVAGWEIPKIPESK